MLLAGLHSGGTQEAMAAAEFAGFYAGDFYGHNLFAKQSYQPANGAYKAKIMVSPTHVFGEVQAGQNVHQQAGQQVLYSSACQMLYSIYIIIANYQILNIHALATSKAQSSLGGLAVNEGNFSRGALGLNSAISLSFSYTASNKGHAARSAIHLYAFKGNAQLGHFLSCQFLQLSQDTGHKFRRNFFSTNFKE